jgi:hypothetical protein
MRTLNQWSLAMNQINAQLKILDDMAVELKQRHYNIMQHRMCIDGESLEYIHREIRSIEKQIDIWLIEFADIYQMRQTLETKLESIQLLIDDDDDL